MKLKIMFRTNSPNGSIRNTEYVVSSLPELFGKMMTLRNLTRLRTVELKDRDGAISYRLAAQPHLQSRSFGIVQLYRDDGTHDGNRGYSIDFDADRLRDPEYVDQLAGAVWQAIQARLDDTAVATPGGASRGSNFEFRHNRDHNPQPAAFRRGAALSRQRAELRRKAGAGTGGVV